MMDSPSSTAIAHSLPADPASDNPRRVWRQWWLLVALIAVLTAGAAGWMHQRAAERTRALAAIVAAGGRWHKPTGPSYFERVLASMFGASVDDRRYDVWITGAEVDDAWLSRNGDLRSIPIDQLSVTKTRLSRDAALRLLEQNRLICFNVPSIALTDVDAQLIGEQDRLTHLCLMQSEITDTGFAALQPQRLIAINVAGTRVTPAALCSGLTGARLQSVGVDGRQFTSELAAQLSGMKSVNMIHLMGPEIADAHVKLLEAMPNLAWIGIDQTSASDAAIAALKAAKPKANVDVYDAKTSPYKWRDDSGPGTAPASDEK
jgi:hypothetical protein